MDSRWRAMATGGGLTLLGVALGGAITLALTAGQPTTPDGTKPPVVTARVSDEPVVDAITADARMVAAGSVPVVREGVHTATGAAAGETLTEGDVVTVVNEQATILLKGIVPMYRALRPGMAGADVAQLRASLGRLGLLTAAKGNSFDASTAGAVLRLFAKTGHRLLTDSGTPATTANLVVPQQALAFISSLPAKADQTCGHAGNRAGETVCTIETLARSPVLSVPAGQAAEVEPAMTVRITLSGGQSHHGTVTAAVGSGSGASKTEGEEPGKQFGVNLTTPIPAGSHISGATIVVKQSRKEDLSVPAVSLKNVAGSQAQIRTKEGATIPVTVGMCAQGRCVIKGDSVKQAMEVLTS